jgi:hypothetical protein
MSSRNLQGCQLVITLIIKGSHTLSSGSYFGRHFGHQVSSRVVTFVITDDLPHHQLRLLVILVTTLLSFSSLGLNHGDNEYNRGRQCHHMGQVVTR